VPRTSETTVCPMRKTPVVRVSHSIPLYHPDPLSEPLLSPIWGKEDKTSEEIACSIDRLSALVTSNLDIYPLDRHRYQPRPDNPRKSAKHLFNIDMLSTPQHDERYNHSMPTRDHSVSACNSLSSLTPGSYTTLSSPSQEYMQESDQR
jgi:hypothetical protein